MRTLLVRLALVAAVLGGGRALAESPCLADAARLCPGIPPGDARIWDCLQRSQFQLSAACQQNLQEIQRVAAEFSADCASDIYRLCARTPAGQWRIIDCLTPYLGRRELASNCESAVTKALERLQEFADACAQDRARLCPGVEGGSGKLFLCLRSQSEKLSSRCKRAVSP